MLNEDYMIGVPRPSRLPTGAGFSRPAGGLPNPSPLGVGHDERTAVGIAAAVLGNEILISWFPSEKTALYLSFVPEESVFPQALQNFEQMRVLAGNATKAVSNVSPAIAETYQVFEKPVSGLDHR